MSKAAQKMMMPLMMITCCVLVVLLQFGFIFLLLAMLPSIAAFYVDNDKGYPTFQTVLCCNLAATLPSLTPMLKASLNMQRYDVGAVMGNATVWLYVWSGALAGLCLIYLCRFIARFVVTLQYEYNIASLERLQKYLVDEWGTQIKQHPKV